MTLSGGPEKLIKDSKGFIQSASENPENFIVPLSLKGLGRPIGIDPNMSMAIFVIGSAGGYADSFGYIVGPNYDCFTVPDYLNYLEFYRIWKMADGVCFYEM